MLLIQIIRNGFINNHRSTCKIQLVHREKIEKRLDCRAGLSFVEAAIDLSLLLIFKRPTGIHTANFSASIQHENTAITNSSLFPVVFT